MIKCLPISWRRRTKKGRHDETLFQTGGVFGFGCSGLVFGKSCFSFFGHPTDFSVERSDDLAGYPCRHVSEKDPRDGRLDNLTGRGSRRHINHHLVSYLGEPKPDISHISGEARPGITEANHPLTSPGENRRQNWGEVRPDLTNYLPRRFCLRIF